MEDYSSEINNLIYVDRDIEDAKWEKIGREIAKNEGQIIGEQKKQQEIIKTALENNFDVETIAKLTKVSVDEVLKIKEKIENEKTKSN